MTAGTQQISEPTACLESAVSDTELNVSVCALTTTAHAHDEASSDSDDAAKIDSSKSADILTSAAATWCVHEAYQSPQADPLVSFFSQLVSSHSVMHDSSQEQDGQSRTAPKAEGLTTCQLPQTSVCPEVRTFRDAPSVIEATSSVKRAADETLEDDGSELTIVEEPLASDKEEYFAKSTVDSDIKEYLSQSLKRDNFRHILGSIRSAISDNPQIFGSLDSPEAGETLPGSSLLREGKGFSRPRQRSQERGTLISPQGVTCSAPDGIAEGRMTAEALLPPPVPVNLEFCRANPRTAVSWLVHAQVTAALGKQAAPAAQDQVGKFQAAAPKRLDPDTEALLACLVPPACLFQHASSKEIKRVPQLNPPRDALGKKAARLVAILDPDGRQALMELVHAWYYSGFFTGQLCSSRSSKN